MTLTPVPWLFPCFAILVGAIWLFLFGLAVTLAVTPPPKRKRPGARRPMPQMRPQPVQEARPSNLSPKGVSLARS